MNPTLQTPVSKVDTRKKGWLKIRYVSALALLVGFGQPAFSQTYCPSDGGTGNVINIDRVVLGDLDNASGDNDGYGDFTALSVSATAGSSLPVSLDPSGPFFLRYRWRAWLDLNNDGNFADPGERVLQESGFGVQNGTVNIPVGTPEGSYRMRISMRAFSYVGPCENYFLGEVEDYTVTVISACDAVAGGMSTSKPNVCLPGDEATLSATPNGAAFVPQGFSQAYVLTSGTGLVIEQLGAIPEFTVTTAGLYTIHSFVFPTDLDLSVVILGVTTGFDVNGLLIQGGGSLCASLDVAGAQFTVSDPLAGTMSGGGDACSNGDSAILTATANGDANVPAGYSQAYVLTSGAGLVIEQLGANPEFTVTTGGLYTIHSFVFPTDLDLSVVVPGVTTGFDVNGLLVQGGGSLCASLDVAGTQFNVADPMAGTMSGGADVCFTGDDTMLTATANGDANVPDGYSQAYVLTSGTGLVIEQLGGTPEFTVTTGGLYTIHSFVFPTDLDLSVVVPGTTTGFDVNGLLVQGGGSLCASLDVAGAQFNVADPMAGTMSGGADVCFTGDDAVLTATANGDANVPAGYSQAYVLTSGAGLVIEQLGANPEFTVTTGGLYTIHSFVFPTDLDLSVVVPGTTTGFDVNGLLVQGGGSLCASLDVAGAQFNVADPMAGTMSGGSDVCLQGDDAILTATANGDANVPDGYSQAYVLTSGAGLVIEQLGGTPEFTVTTGGLFTIHSFVFPTDLDLSVVVPGTTTGFDVNGLLVQGGGSLCASLDVAGAQFNVADPMAGTMSGGAAACFNGDNAMLMATANGDANVPAGYSQAYVLTSGAGLVIEQLGATPEFTVTTGGLYTIHSFVFPSDLDLSVVVPGTTTGFDVNGLLVQGGGSLCASLDVAGAQFNVTDPMAGTMSGGSDVCLNGDNTMLMATANGDANVPAGYSQAYVLTSGAGLVIEQLGATPEFTVTTGGLYTIHSFVFPTGLDLSVVVPGTTTGFDVNGLLVQGGGSLCASLDVAGAQFNVTDPMAGSMSGGSDVCLNGDNTMLMAIANGDANVPAGYSQAYVLTSGAGLVIEQLGATPEFTVTTGGLYTIHSFVFPTGLDLSVVVPGTTTGFDVNGLLVQGGGSICASLDVAGAQFNVTDPMAGTMSGGADVCFNGDNTMLMATANGDANVPAGYSQAYVLTSGAGLVIEQLGATPEFTVTTGGLYTIHSFVFPSDLDLSVVVPGTTTGFDVNGLLVQGGGSLCASLDVAGAQFNVTDPMAGSMSGGGDVCLQGDGAVLVATANGDANVPAGYSQAYVLTSGAGLVIEQLGATPEFTVTTGGLYTIHSFVFPTDLDLSVVVPGTTTGFDVNGLLVQGGGSLCASLDVAGTQFNVTDPMAGTMSGGADVCLQGDDAMLMATANGDANVPAGYSQAYVLTSGAGLVIEQLGATPEFTVTTGGLYTIHSFVFPSDLDLSVVVPGTTTGFDVNGLLVQGGGSLCASLDVAGAQFNVADPMAGTMSGGADACFNGDEATLTATANGDANVPAGYSQAYVLTSGAGLVIEQLGATPEFTVTTGGLYTIHSFVFPSDLDLSVVVPGTTTGFDVNGLLVQGGGSLCASLDVAGAQFNVTDPMAGTMIGGSDACLVDGSAMLMATANGDANVPAGYSQAYVLTSGAGLVIEQLGATPEFTVTTGGLYTIHSFVFPSDLDLSVVVPGTTTGFDVNGLLVQGGGSLCASLDVAGAQFNVAECACTANAGTLTAVSDEACLVNGQVTISANANGDANVPAGYSQAYVLTSGTGLVIEQLGGTPEFTVTSGGLYTIHSFVFPSDLDLSIVVPGVTTGFDVNGLLIQGGGELCASLDVAGAPVQVSGPYAGNINPDHFLNCLSNGSTTLNGNPAGDAQVPAGYSTVYVLTRGQGLVIVNAGATPEFTVTQTGLYRIHTLVYDANTLDLGIVVPGTTTGFDVNSLLVQGGGTICASLDVSGAPFLVLNGWICNFFQPLFINDGTQPMDQLSNALGRDASSLSDAELKSLTNDVPVKATLYPVPATDILNISLETRLPMNMEVSVLDMSGRIVRANKSFALEAGVRNFTIDVNDLDNGNYLVRMVTNGEVITEQFVKVQ